MSKQFNETQQERKEKKQLLLDLTECESAGKPPGGREMWENNIRDAFPVRV